MRVVFILAASVILLLPARAEGPYPRWLAIGDSITQHAMSEELQWFGESRGMAASSVSLDYVHLLLARLQARDPRNATDLKIVGRVARLSAGTVEKMDDVADELRAWGPDLVTIQLGENDHLDQIGADKFEQCYRRLIEAVLSAPKRPIVVCTGVWLPGVPLDPADGTKYAAAPPAVAEGREKDLIIEKICREKGLIFVPVAPFASVPQNHGAGVDKGVQWHPNDAGMRGYADALFNALYPEPQVSAASPAAP